MTRVSRFSPYAVLTALAVVCALPAPATAGPDGVVPDHERPRSNKYEARIDEMIGAQVPLEVAFRDEGDKPVTLRECIGGKPTILVPVYYRCPMLCTEVLNGLLKALRGMPPGFDAGDKFNVVTVSMDPKEHGELATEKKKAYLGEYGRPGAEAGWRFLTGTKDAVQVLLDTVGYRFEFDKMLKEYNHPSALIILSPEGKVTRYFYGIGYDKEYKIDGPEVTAANGTRTQPTTTLRLSLLEAAEGKSGSLSLTERLTLLCYRYDRLHQGYALNVLRTVQAGGIVTLLLVVAGVFMALNREGTLGAFLRDAVPYVLGLVIMPFFALVALIVASPDAAMKLSPKLLVPYYVVAGGALYAWNRSRAKLAAAGPNPTLPPEGTA